METLTLTNPLESLRFTLSGLGPDFFSAIAVLKAERITGLARDLCHCPISHWLKSRLPGDFLTYPTYIEWQIDGESYYVSLSSQLQTFLRIFDNYLLPSLLGSSAECGFWECEYPKRPPFDHFDFGAVDSDCSHVHFREFHTTNGAWHAKSVETNG